ncbi:MAG: hypothetical protein Pg6C_12480 [Treponemataceae bacterium]|nr:MAG: hypothetical protein Pg6C_12480 [Treponemataceae bacterium]
MVSVSLDEMKEAKEYWLAKCVEDKIYSTAELRLPHDDGKKIYPSDFCYNKTNKGDLDKGFPHYKEGYLCFLFMERGQYKYIGFDKGVTCKTVWTDKNGKETIVGEWVYGKYTKQPVHSGGKTKAGGL